MKAAKDTTKATGVPEAWQPLLELAVREVFEIMLGCKLETRHPVYPITAEITAMVGLAGQLCGLVKVRCSAQSAALMVSKMLGVKVNPADEEMWDAMGEMANMVAGNFKNKLTGMADRCMLSVPTVITGSDYSCRSMAATHRLEVTLLFAGAPVIVTVEIHT
jgi:chemotaxis protein CheX